MRIDSAIYTRNIECLKKNYGELADKIEKVDLNQKFKLVTAGRNNYVNVYCEDIGELYYEDEDPMQGVRNEVSELTLNNAKIALFLGFGLGYSVEYFAKECSFTSNTKQLIIIEKDLELFKLSLVLKDFTPMISNNNVLLLVGMDTHQMFIRLEKFYRDSANIAYIKAIKPIYTTASFKLDRTFYFDALRAVKEASLYLLTFYGNSPDDALIGLENILDNINVIIENPGIKDLYDKFSGKPAVIVATGPSLDKNKHLLKGLDDKALIIAADASLRVLKQMNVRPHMVTSLERFPNVARLFENFSEEDLSEIYLAGCPVIHNSVFETYKGPKIMVYRNYEHFRWIGIDKGILDIKQSAGNMAFKVADALGCNPIILIGQDLAYGDDGASTHAKGHDFGDKQQSFLNDDYLKSNSVYVKGNYKDEVLTSRDWDSFRKAYEVDVSTYEGVCINATEGGAYIKGTVVMTFNEAIKKYINEPIDPLKIIKENLKLVDSKLYKEQFDQIFKLINTTIKDLVFMRDEAILGINYLTEKQAMLQDFIDDKKYLSIEEVDTVYNTIITHRVNITSRDYTFQRFLVHIVQSFFIKIEIDLNEIPDIYAERSKQSVAISLMHLKWFIFMHDTINICIQSLEKSLINLKSRSIVKNLE